jgi:hypothetical protein
MPEPLPWCPYGYYGVHMDTSLRGSVLSLLDQQDQATYRRELSDASAGVGTETPEQVTTAWLVTARQLSDPLRRSVLTGATCPERAGQNLHSVEFRADWVAAPYVTRVGWFRWEGYLIRKERGIRLLNVGRTGEGWNVKRVPPEPVRLSPLRRGLTRRAVMARLEDDKALVAEAYEALRRSTVRVHTTTPDGSAS